MKTETTKTEQTVKFFHNMHRSCTSQIVGGVCGGLAEQTNFPAWVFRGLFVLLSLLYGIGVIAYIILWISLPLKMKVPFTSETK